MKVEVDRFPDGRLKVILRYSKKERNLWIGNDDVTVCPTLKEPDLVKDALEAADLFDHLPRDPTNRSALIKEILDLIEQRLFMRTKALA